MKGSIVIPEKTRVDLDFQRVDLSALKFEDDIDALSRRQKPYITFACQELRIGEKLLGNVHFDLNPMNMGYELRNFSAKTNAYLLTATGGFQMGSATSTRIQGKIQSSDMGSTLRQLGFTSAIRHSHGGIRFGFQWEGLPFQVEWQKLKGSAHIEMYKGRILGINTGMGNFFSLIQLDFKQAFKSGFAFDSLVADLVVQNGAAYTDGFFVEGPLAKVELKGSTELKAKTLDIDVIVMPKVGLNLPLGVAALATENPIVGAVSAGAWAFNKILGPGGPSKAAPSTKSNARPSYHVTGTWDAPNIRKN